LVYHLQSGIWLELSDSYLLNHSSWPLP
jgi:hypothetical protein